ncbi:MAG: NAD(+) kinase [Pseudomonadota bacterium]
MGAFSTIGLVAHNNSELIQESFGRVIRCLQDQSVDVLVEAETSHVLPAGDLQVLEADALGQRCDLIIAVGGDGNILGTARLFAPLGVPVVGVNRGRLGFLADISPDDIESALKEVLAGNYSIEEHFLLEGEVSVDGRQEVASALNEVLVHSAKMPKMIEFDLYVDDEFVYTQYSDGLIISSPTGSTAYALSAGGPIMVPSLDALVLVPMFPHTLNSRPLMVKGDSEIRIVVGSHIGTNARVSFDSHLEFEIEPGESLTVTQQSTRLKLIHPPGHSFYQVCRSKLDWASRVGE